VRNTQEYQVKEVQHVYNGNQDIVFNAVGFDPSADHNADIGNNR
jgi:hypothetical protein